jgi:pilus assembly protein CpaC
MKRGLMIACLLTVISLVFLFEGYTQENLDAVEELRMYMGENKVISVSSPKRVAIGNPAIADIASVDKNGLTIVSKGVGKTTLVFLDNFGEQSYTIKVFAEDMQEIKKRIDNLLSNLALSNVRTEAQDEEGKVVLLGEVKTSQERERIFSVLGSLKEKIVDLLRIKEEESAVEIDVQILELNKGSADTLGLTWPGSVNLQEVGSAAIPLASAVGAGWDNLFKISKLSRDAFTLKLDMLIQEGQARVLSRPRLACQSGKEAELLVGGEKPILTTTVAATTGAEGTSVEYKEYGIKLKIIPIVTDYNRVKLNLKVEVSDFDETPVTIGSANQPTAKAFPLNKRNASTELFLSDGQTMSIGGLIKQKKEETVRKVPWFSDVPVLGLLFRQKTTTLGGGASARSDTELVIILTPTIINNTVIEDMKKNSERVVRRESSPQAVVAKLEPLISPVDKYAALVQKKIIDNLVYPVQAKGAGFQGTVKLNLFLSYRGELKKATIKESSGYNILDKSAISTAKAISMYPPFPPDINSEELSIDVPIAYKLD